MEEKHIQYLGEPGAYAKCLLAVSAILNSGRLPERVTIVTYEVKHGKTFVEHHLFLFWNWGGFLLTIVPAGFSSGYFGGGPIAFSIALCMIKSKQVPMYEYYTDNGDKFADINENKIPNISNPVYQEIKDNSGKLTYLRSVWVLPEHKEMLDRGQIWRAFDWYSEPKCDWVTEAIADVDLYHPDVGSKLRIAESKLKDTEHAEEWQSSGILIRDSWIELIQKICQERRVDISDISDQDKVKYMLRKLRLNEKVEKFIMAVFNPSLYVQHKRNMEDIDLPIVKACLAATVLTMQMLTRKEFKELGPTLNEIISNLQYGESFGKNRRRSYNAAGENRGYRGDGAL